MIKKAVFAPTGKGDAYTVRVTVPSAYVELLKITKEDRDINITYEDGKVIITKA